MLGMMYSLLGTFHLLCDAKNTHKFSKFSTMMLQDARNFRSISSADTKWKKNFLFYEQLFLKFERVWIFIRSVRKFYRVHDTMEMREWEEKSTIQWHWKSTRGTAISRLSALTHSAIIPHRNFTIFLTYTLLRWNVVGNFSSTVLNLCKLLCWANKIKAKKKKKQESERKVEKKCVEILPCSLWCWDVINRNLQLGDTEMGNSWWDSF